MDIREFLTARLDEDEALVRAVPAWAADRWEPWRSKHDMQLLAALKPGLPPPPQIDYSVPSDTYDAEWITHWGHIAAFRFENAPVTRFIACHDPDRVLREVEAKRKRIEMHDPGRDGGFCAHCERPWPCEDVCLEAGVYAGHPDYDPAWTVDS